MLAGLTTPAKAEAVLEAGADHIIDLSVAELRDSVRQQVDAATDGRRIDVVVDMVGGDVFDRSLKCIAWNGRLLVIGFASGRIPEVKANRILLKNIAVTGLHWGAHATHDPERIDQTFEALFRLYGAGQIKPVIFKNYSLDDVAAALQALGSRKTYGKLIVAP